MKQPNRVIRRKGLRRSGQHPPETVELPTGEVIRVGDPVPGQGGVSLRTLGIVLAIVSLAAGFFVSQPHTGFWLGIWLVDSLLLAVAIPVALLIFWMLAVSPSEDPPLYQ